jgi:hypothetical protein
MRKAFFSFVLSFVFLINSANFVFANDVQSGKQEYEYYNLINRTHKSFSFNETEKLYAQAKDDQLIDGTFLTQVFPIDVKYKDNLGILNGRQR